MGSHMSHPSHSTNLLSDTVTLIRFMDVEASSVLPGVGSTYRRPPSLRRVAIEGDCPGFIGTTRTLRLPAFLPAALRFLRLAVPPLRRVFAPACRPTRRHGASGAVVHAATRWAAIYRWRGQDLPSSRTGPLPSRSCSIRPRRVQPELALTLRPTRPRLRERPWLSQWTFEAQSHGFTTRCPRFKAPGCPDAMQDSLLTRAATLWWAGLKARRACIERFL